MHYLIRVIVKADNGVEALQKAELFMDDLVKRGEYDWYDMDGRWGKSVAHLLDSPHGKELLNNGMQYARENFDRSMAAIRFMLENYTDDQIFEEDFTQVEGMYLSRYQFHCIYGDGSGNAFVYGDDDVWGSGVDNQTAVNRILADPEAKDFWIVPIDVHN